MQRECGHDPQLRREVDSLLAANDQAAGFLNEPAVQAAEARLANTVEANGTSVGMRIGPYRLLQEIGEGGFGVSPSIRDRGRDRRRRRPPAQIRT